MWHLFSKGTSCILANNHFNNLSISLCRKLCQYSVPRISFSFLSSLTNKFKYSWLIMIHETVRNLNAPKAHHISNREYFNALGEHNMNTRMHPGRGQIAPEAHYTNTWMRLGCDQIAPEAHYMNSDALRGATKLRLRRMWLNKLLHHLTYTLPPHFTTIRLLSLYNTTTNLQSFYQRHDFLNNATSQPPLLRPSKLTFDPS